MHTGLAVFLMDVEYAKSYKKNFRFLFKFTNLQKNMLYKQNQIFLDNSFYKATNKNKNSKIHVPVFANSIFMVNMEIKEIICIK